MKCCYTLLSSIPTIEGNEVATKSYYLILWCLKHLLWGIFVHSFGGLDTYIYAKLIPRSQIISK